MFFWRLTQHWGQVRNSNFFPGHWVPVFRGGEEQEPSEQEIFWRWRTWNIVATIKIQPNRHNPNIKIPTTISNKYHHHQYSSAVTNMPKGNEPYAMQRSSNENVTKYSLPGTWWKIHHGTLFDCPNCASAIFNSNAWEWELPLSCAPLTNWVVLNFLIFACDDDDDDDDDDGDNDEDDDNGDNAWWWWW